MLSFKESPEEEFWKIKMTRHIDECSSVSELKQIATLLVTLCSTRQTVIKGLVQDAVDTMNKQLESRIGS